MIPVNVPQHSGAAWISYHLTDAWKLGDGVYYAGSEPNIKYPPLCV